MAENIKPHKTINILLLTVVHGEKKLNILTTRLIYNLKIFSTIPLPLPLP